MSVIRVRWLLLPHLTTFQQWRSCDEFAFFTLWSVEMLAVADEINETKSHDGKGNCGAQIKETLAGRAGCRHSSARLSAPARSRQALASTPIYYSGALLVSPQPKCQWQKQKSPQRFTRAQRTLPLLPLLLLRSTSRSRFCFILRSVLSYLGLHAHEGESNREPHQK